MPPFTEAYAKVYLPIFLQQIRDAIDTGNVEFAGGRQKNIKTLAALGILPDDMYDEIKNLSITDYYRGPLLDENEPDEDMYWAFRKAVGCELIYIKLKIKDREGKRLFVMSFHFDGMYD